MNKIIILLAAIIMLPVFAGESSSFYISSFENRTNYLLILSVEFNHLLIQPNTSKDKLQIPIRMRKINKKYSNVPVTIDISDGYTQNNLFKLSINQEIFDKKADTIITLIADNGIHGIWKDFPKSNVNKKYYIDLIFQENSSGIVIPDEILSVKDVDD